jgi:hypothetical protein
MPYTCCVSEIAQSLSDEMDARFPQHDILDAFGIIYPQYWMQEGADISFQQHLSEPKAFYCTAREVNGGKPFLEGGDPFTVPKLLSASKLEVQQGLFKVTMKANAVVACTSPFTMNPRPNICTSSFRSM